MEVFLGFHWAPRLSCNFWCVRGQVPGPPTSTSSFFLWSNSFKIFITPISTSQENSLYHNLFQICFAAINTCHGHAFCKISWQHATGRTCQNTISMLPLGGPTRWDISTPSPVPSSHPSPRQLAEHQLSCKRWNQTAEVFKISGEAMTRGWGEVTVEPVQQSFCGLKSSRYLKKLLDSQHGTGLQGPVKG